MHRRQFLHGATALAAGTGPITSRRAHAAQADPPLDRFGGWKAKRFRPTGFFRIEKDKRWWLVTPEGHAFLSWGINHLHPDLWKQDYNRQAWQAKLGLKDLQGPEFPTALRSWFLDTCRRFGFNTVGVHTQLNVVNRPQPRMAYMQPIRFVDVPHWRPEVPDENFVDVFSDDFARHCDLLAKKIALPIRNDPFLLGYAMTDCTMFTEEDLRERTDTIGGARRPARIGWPRRLRNLGARAAGKRAYVETVRHLYRDRIADFNQTYGTDFDSFAALETAENWRAETQRSNANETRDNTAFLHRCVASYYQQAHDAIRRYDPHHLFVGDKLNANTDSLDTVLPITSQYTDLVFYQMYGRYEVQRPGLDRWAKRVDKPFLNGDAAFTMTTPTMPRPYGPVADNLTQRAAWTSEFFLRAFARPDFVGWHYCGLIDAPNLVPRKAARQHSGLLNGYGEAYPQLEKVLKRCAGDLYKTATGAS